MSTGAKGSVRVVSKRKGGLMASGGETVIDVDRTHPVLGNPHVLADHRDAGARDKVISLYEQDLIADEQHHGPMTRAIEALRARVEAGERIALRCWCAPQKCHADLLASRILGPFAQPEQPKRSAQRPLF